MADEPKTEPSADVVEQARQIPRAVLETFLTVPWAITDPWLETIRSIIMRESDASPQAIEAYRTQRVRSTDALESREGVAILRMEGPLIRRANMFTAISGGATYESLARDLQAAVDDNALTSILLNIDSPGGEVSGLSELAAAIRTASKRKPMAVFVDGLCCSAAYWAAAAVDGPIVTTETSILGSIGVRMAIRDSSERDSKSGLKTIEFISSRAPNKKLDYDTDAGRARIQREVDSLEAVFISKVALYRGVSEDEVVTKFGGGGTEVGATAVSLGMADRLGSFEDVLAELSSGRSTRGGKALRTMSTPTETIDKTAHDAALAKATSEAQAAGAEAAQKRIGAILGSEEANGRETLAKHFAFEQPGMSAESAIAALKASPKAEAPKAAEPAPGKSPPANRSKDALAGLAGLDADDDSAPKKPDANAKLPDPTFDYAAIYGKYGKAPA